MSSSKCGPSGGSGGAEFSDDAIPDAGKITEVRIRAGARIDAIQIVFETRHHGDVHEMPQNGGNGGSLQVITLDADEFLIGLEGTVAKTPSKRPNHTVHRIRLRTNKQLFQTFGGDGEESYDFRYEAPPGTEIVGFTGRAGSELDAVGVIFRVQ
jgi:hypothetical protein